MGKNKIGWTTANRLEYWGLKYELACDLSLHFLVLEIFAWSEITKIQSVFTCEIL